MKTRHTPWGVPFLFSADPTAIAEQLYERHTVLTRMLVSFGIDEATATEDACRIEHVISDASFEAVKKHYQTYRK